MPEQEKVQPVKLPHIDDPTFRFQLELLKYYREEVKHEFNLLGTRVNSNLTAQSFLVASYAVAMANFPNWGRNYAALFALGLCTLGGFLSYRAMQGVNGACVVIKLWLGQQNKLFHGSETDSDKVIANLERFVIHRVNTTPGTMSNSLSITDKIHENSLKFSRWASPVFIGAWVVFAILTVATYFRVLDGILLWS
jgi:hypothetical protein